MNPADLLSVWWRHQTGVPLQLASRFQIPRESVIQLFCCWRWLSVTMSGLGLRVALLKEEGHEVMKNITSQPNWAFTLERMFSDSWRIRNVLLPHSFCRLHTKHESEIKTSSFRHEPWNFRIQNLKWKHCMRIPEFSCSAKALNPNTLNVINQETFMNGAYLW